MKPSRLAAHQHQLTIADLVVEAHDVHHPIGVDLDHGSRSANQPGARDLHRESDPKVPRLLREGSRPESRRHVWCRLACALGRKLTYAEFSLFQVMVGLDYAFPNALAALGRKLPRLRALRDGGAVPPVAWYLASPRRIPFNEYGIFRHYPELHRAARARSTPRVGRALLAASICPAPAATISWRGCAEPSWTAPTNLLGHLAGFLVSGRRGRRVGGPAAVGWLYEILGPVSAWTGWAR